MTNKLPRILDWLAIAVLTAAAAIAWATSANSAAPLAGSAVGNDAVRIEIQRYMGYEILPARYLSLPYDITMNSNEQVAFLDIGALLLIFVPVLMLWGFARKPVLQGLTILACLFLLVISTANGYIAGLDMGIIKPERQALTDYLNATAFMDAPAGVICAFFYQLFLNVYDGIFALFSRVSGERDAVTYPLLLGCFGLFFYLAARRFEGRTLPEKSLMAFLLVYLFFWLMLSSGIVWYGILAFPVLTCVVFWSAEKRKESADLTGKTVFYGFCFLAGAFVLMGFAQRFSNIKIQILHQDTLAGKRLYDPALLKYQTGDFSEKEVVEAFYPGLTGAVERMNRERKSLIYNVGTRFNFFILDNDKRIFKDNQLDLFEQIVTKYPSKAAVTDLLKKSGFAYFMVDFNTPTADKTPEQTLVEKFKKLLLLFYENPGIELVATNRILKETVNGKLQYKPGVFGEVQSPGSYAIFRIK